MNSMTGYGMGERSTENFNCKIEIKSVNNRYCDIQVRIPKAMLALEEIIRREIKKKISRGKVDVYINYQVFGSDSTDLSVDRGLVEKYVNELNSIQEEFDISGFLDINTIPKLQGVFELNPGTLDMDKINEPFMGALDDAISGFVEMRKNEGENLKADLKEKLETLKPHVEFLKKSAPELLDQNLKNFLDRFHTLAEGEEYDQARLTTELTIMSDKLCIDEEITRIASHMAQFNDIMESNDPIGRKLDFLLQELNREVNTIGSKTSDLPVTNHVVEMKSIIEQMREQVQNIE